VSAAARDGAGLPAGAAVAVAAEAEDLAFAPGPLRVVAAFVLGAAGVALVALTLVEAWQVFARYALGSPAAWTEPVALLLLKTALMLAAAVGVRHETHFRFALGAAAAGPRARAALEAFARLATAAIGATFAIWGARLALATWELKVPGAAFSSGLLYVPFVLGGILFVLFALERLIGARALPRRG
jgi:TRAP-type C4-dicarboxylate transport system permease small subunit